MNNTIPQLHLYQKEILRKLLLSDTVQFNELNIEGLESEHMNYHLKKLIDRGFVEKKDGAYHMTNAGKDYSNMLDDDIRYVEKQPKTSVIINAVRLNENGEIKFLLNRRLRHPYMGKVGRAGGKSRFDETLWETAERELYEETGLKAKDLVLEEIYHKIRYSEDGEILQNVLFYIFFTTKLEGDFIDRTEWQENFWITRKEAENSEEYDLYDDLVLDERLEPKKLSFSEKKTLAEGY